MTKPRLARTKEPALNDLLDKAARNLLNRVLNPAGEADAMTVAEETAAFKCVMNYYAMKKKLAPLDDDNGGFNGFRDAIASPGRGNGARNPASFDGPVEDPGF